MSLIGTFTKTPNGFTGAIRTAMIDLQVEIRQIAKASDKAPDYRAFVGEAEFGVGWIKTNVRLGEYPSLKFDDPSFAAPIYANLVPHENTPGIYVLLWSR